MNRRLDKVLGGRWLTLVIDSITYPFCIVLCGTLAVMGEISTETFIAVLGGYALLVKETRLKYFDRSDRFDKEKINDKTA